MNEILEQVRTNEAIAATSNLNIRRIVVPVDLSAHSENTAAYAVALAKTFGAGSPSSMCFHQNRLRKSQPKIFTKFMTENGIRKGRSSAVSPTRFAYPIRTVIRSSVLAMTPSKFTLLRWCSKLI